MAEDCQQTAILNRNELHEKLKWLMLFRVAVATILLITGVIVQFRESGTLLNAVTATFYPVAGLVFFLSILYIPILKYARKAANIARSQALIDIIIITFIVYISGGTDSPLSFLYMLTIISSTIVSYGNGGLWTASVSSIFYGILINIEYHNVLPSMVEVVTGLPQRLPDNLLYNTLANITAFYLVSFLSSYLSIQAKKAEEELLEKKIDYQSLEALNNDIVKNISSGLMTIDSNGIITSFNQAAEKMTGYSLEQVYGKNVHEILPDLDDMLKELNIHGPSNNIRRESWFKRADGKDYYIGYSMSPLRNSEGEQVGEIVVFQDLTTLKTMERELQKSDRLAAVGRFAASVAHEIRNPLASISGSIEILEKDLSGNMTGANERLMGIVLREIDRLNILIGEFLNYARPAVPRKQRININELISETIDLFINSEKEIKSIEIVNNCSTMAPIEADEGQIKQLVWNLIKNASDAMDEGGVVTIGDKAYEKNDKKGIEISISDTGCGMTREEAEKIFDPFYTSKEKGSGLGLSVAHSIIEAHDGFINVESEAGKGSTFTIMLPCK
ncbi:MAG: ATP-binding protein [Deltaproteobacteria bacterium]|nr:ATP-binding protein [Deltaproteobacteria bacterium]